MDCGGGARWWRQVQTPASRDRQHGPGDPAIRSRAAARATPVLAKADAQTGLRTVRRGGAAREQELALHLQLATADDAAPVSPCSPRPRAGPIDVAITRLPGIGRPDSGRPPARRRPAAALCSGPAAAAARAAAAFVFARPQRRRAERHARLGHRRHQARPRCPSSGDAQRPQRDQRLRDRCTLRPVRPPVAPTSRSAGAARTP